jgi:excisionase family DNA binding protein
MHKFYTPQEIAELLKVSKRTVYRYLHTGKLKASKFGHWRISKEDLDKFIKKNSN